MTDHRPARPDVTVPQPMLAINTPSLRHVTPPDPISVEVWVEDFPSREPVRPGWYLGQLAEWTLFDEPIGWTGWVRFSTGPAERFNGRFAAAAIRQL